MILGKLRYHYKYLAIQYFSQEKHWSIVWMCKALNISRAAYYKWLNRSVPKQEQENILIGELVKEYDEKFNHILGYRRMTLWVNKLNHKSYSRNRIHRIMKKLSIKSVIRQKKKNYRPYNPETTAENTLKRDFNASAPNTKWVTDVTEFKWYEGPVVRKLYLSAILDLYDRSIVAYVVSCRNDNKLVFDTFDKAIAANPNAKPLFHSDRGFQYTNSIFKLKIETQGMTQSMSRVSHCIDNGPVEGFWGIVKTEMYYLMKFEDEKTLRASIDKYIHFYNNERFQERFGGKTPAEVRNNALSASTPIIYPIAENKRIKKYKAKYAA